jgi:hypothetical protein
LLKGGDSTPAKAACQVFSPSPFIPVFGEKVPTLPFDFYLWSASASRCDFLVGWASRIFCFFSDRFLN